MWEMELILARKCCPANINLIARHVGLREQLSDGRSTGMSRCSREYRDFYTFAYPASTFRTFSSYPEAVLDDSRQTRQ